MPSVSLNVKQQLSNVIKKFKFEELEAAIFPIFPELSWERVKAKLVKKHESLTTLHALQYIQEDINKASISDSVLKDRLATLEVIDVSRHYKRKVWYTYELKGRESPSFFTLQEIENQVKHSFDVYSMEMEVRAVNHNGLVFVSIKDRPKKKQKKTIMPTYFCLVMNENYFFCSKKVILKNSLMALTNGVGYKSCKQIKLMGKDIHSLLQMLLNRKTAALQSEIIKVPLPFKRALPIVSSAGIDFTQHKQRQEYAEKCFGSNPPTFEFLRVKSMDQKWKHAKAREKLPDDEIFTGIEFKSANIPNLLKNLITGRVLSAPLPVYAANILSVGRNDLTVKEIGD